MRAISDSSPIIAFFEELDSYATLLLLKDLGYELSVPQAVREEITKDPGATLLAQCISDGDVVLLQPLEPRDIRGFQLSHPVLDDGETAVILHALEIGRTEDVVSLLDEGPARRVAQGLGLRVTGTVGVLNLLRDANLISEAEDRTLRQRLGASSFRVGGDILERR